MKSVLQLHNKFSIGYNVETSLIERVSLRIDQRKGSSIRQTDCQPQRLWYVKPIVETEGHYRVDFGESNYLSVMFELDIRKIGGFVRVNPKRSYSNRERKREEEEEEEEEEKEEEERNKYTPSGNRDLLLELYQSCCEGILD
ncbi:hypothetical protein V1477_013155 [Vespula maculifrons]|uniref:Uncharacterized protein n=1 Tax=Vespula maculifrons TaxID=7453 RepID=A0ABD2BV42_VESMC